MATQQETLSEVKLEANTEEVLVKKEPGTKSQVITAEFYRKFIEASTGHGKPPLNPKDKRDCIRVLKENFGKALEPYKTSANTYPFDEEVANSVFITLHTEKRNQTQLFKHNELSLQHIKQLFQYGIWQNELKQNIEAEIVGRLVVLDKPLKRQKLSCPYTSLYRPRSTIYILNYIPWNIVTLIPKTGGPSKQSQSFPSSISSHSKFLAFRSPSCP